MQYYHISHGKDGYRLHIGNKSFTKTLLVRLAEKIDLFTGERWCSGLRNEWFWNYSIGKRRYDEHGLVNSINDRILNTFNKVIHLEWDSEKEAFCAPLTTEEARKIDSDFVNRCEEIFNA